MLHFVVGTEQLDLMTRHFLHRRDRLGIQLKRLPHLRIVRENHTQLLIQSVLDIGGNVDLIDTQLRRLADLLVRVAGTAVQYKRNGNGLLDFL